MAAGCDLYFAEAILALRRQGATLTLEAAVPCREQADRWDAPARNRYEELLGMCDSVTVLQERYSQGCMQRRNRYMVDHAGVLLAVYDGTTGGTGATFRYAVRKGLEIIRLTP